MPRLDGDGRAVAARLVVTAYSDGAVSVEGPVSEREWCLALLAHARDAVLSHHRRTAEIVVPARDVELPESAGLVTR